MPDSVRKAIKCDRAIAIYDELMGLAKSQMAGLEVDEQKGNWLEITTVKIEKQKFYAEQVRQAIISAMAIDLQYQQLLATLGIVTAEMRKPK